MSQLDLLNEAKAISNSIKEWQRIADLLQNANTKAQITSAIGALKLTIENGSKFFEPSDVKLHLKYYVTMGYCSDEEAKELA